MSHVSQWSMVVADRCKRLILMKTQWFLFSGNSTLIKTEIGILNSISAPKSPKILHTGPEMKYQGGRTILYTEH